MINYFKLSAHSGVLNHLSMNQLVDWQDVGTDIVIFKQTFGKFTQM